MDYNSFKKYFANFDHHILPKSSRIATIKLIEKYEDTWKIPIYKQSYLFVQDMVNKECEYNKGISALKFYSVKVYLKLCEQHFEDSICGVSDRITLSWISEQKNKMVKSPTHLKIYLDDVFLSKGREATEAEVIYKAYCWLVYMGILDDDLHDLTAENVNLDEMAVYVNGLKYMIYTDAYSSIKACVEEEVFEYVHPKYRSIIQRYPEGTEVKRLLRGVKGEATTQSLKNKFSNLAEQALKEGRTSIRLNYQSIRSSGLFYRAYESELSSYNADVNFFDAVWQEFGEKFKDDDEKSRMTKITRNERLYMESYVQWKLAFKLTDD